MKLTDIKAGTASASKISVNNLLAKPNLFFYPPRQKTPTIEAVPPPSY